MQTINYLAQLWGFSLIIISLALLFNPKQAKHVFGFLNNEASFFLCGVLTLVLGLASVLAVNTWAANWQVTITILGWLAILKGSAILFFPRIAEGWCEKAQSKIEQWGAFVWVVTVLIGCVLVYLGFTA